MREERCFKGADALAEWVPANNLAATPDVLITWRSNFRSSDVRVGVTRLAARWARKNDIQRTDGKMLVEGASH